MGLHKNMKARRLIEDHLGNYHRKLLVLLLVAFFVKEKYNVKITWFLFMNNKKIFLIIGNPMLKIQ